MAAAVAGATTWHGLPPALLDRCSGCVLASVRIEQDHCMAQLVAGNVGMLGTVCSSTLSPRLDRGTCPALSVLVPNPSYHPPEVFCSPVAPALARSAHTPCRPSAARWPRPAPWPRRRWQLPVAARACPCAPQPPPPPPSSTPSAPRRCGPRIAQGRAKPRVVQGTRGEGERGSVHD